MVLGSYYVTNMNLLLKINGSCFCENENGIKTKTIEIFRTTHCLNGTKQTSIGLPVLITNYF